MPQHMTDDTHGLAQPHATPKAPPPDEAQRLRALRHTELLDTPPEERFDRLTRLASQIFNAPIALVSLVDANRQWFKSRHGLETYQTERKVSFCSHAIKDSQIFQVQDAREDPRFRDNPLVTDPPHIRFYAGAPLTTYDGHRIGTLCLISDQPRKLTTLELRMLRDLADCVEAEINVIDLHRQSKALAATQQLSEIITRAQSQFIQERDRCKAFDNLLKDLLTLSSSEYGFIGEVLTNAEGRPYLKTFAITDIAWDEKTRAYYRDFAAEGLEFTNLDTLFGAAMTSGSPVISNDVANDHRSGGLPKGHPALNAFLGVPIYHNDQMLAMFGLANRPQGYDEDLITFLQPLVVTIGQLVHASRLRAQHKKIETSMAEQAGYTQAIIDNMVDGLITIDTKGIIQSFNPSAEEIFGYTASEVLGKNVGILMPSPYREMHNNFLQSYQKTGVAKVIGIGRELEGQRKNGSLFPMELAVSEVKHLSQTHYVGLVNDITERAQNEARLRHLATHDVLTGLPNRSLFMDRLHQAIAQANREATEVGILLIDLDNFKVVNDSFGHHYGDGLLKEVASRLSGIMRAGDTLARLGGDEYAVILVGLSDDIQVHNAAERALSTLLEPVIIDGREVPPTASIGYCQYPQDGQDPETLLRHADAAMYAAKAAGRGVVSGYLDTMNETSRDHLRILSRLRQAVSNNALSLFYQPQVDTVTCRIAGAEALLRWDDAELGSVSPARFIPVAEASGLILPLGQWVLDNACQQITEWLDSGIEMPVAINLSPYQFRQADLTQKILDTCERHGCPTNLLELEITESAAMQSPELTSRQLDALAAAGFSLALDDFGTGYSSLARLGQLRVNKLKIDRSFITKIPGDPAYETLVRATIGLCHEMGMKLVAEGVETEAQRQFLLRHGCSAYQGWLFSKALPAKQFMALTRPMTN